MFLGRGARAVWRGGRLAARPACLNVIPVSRTLPPLYCSECTGLRVVVGRLVG